MDYNYTSYFMPTNKEMKADGYFNDDLYRPKHYQPVYDSLTSFGSPISKQCSIYKEVIGNFRTPTIRLLAFYAYGINNPQQFNNTLDIAIYQAIYRTAFILFGVSKKYSEEDMRVKLRELPKLINIVHTNLHKQASYNANLIKNNLSKVWKHIGCSVNDIALA